MIDFMSNVNTKSVSATSALVSLVRNRPVFDKFRIVRFLAPECILFLFCLFELVSVSLSLPLVEAG